MSNYQERVFLYLLDESEETKIIRKILNSPLGLAKEIVKNLFEDKLGELKNNLDTIKMFVAGVRRAESLSADYALAKYYPNMFAFHQFFNSSFRARQGKALEEMIKIILTNYGNFQEVPDKAKRMQEILSESFGVKIENLDIDAMGLNTNQIILIQLRSRDDTGGTTAKSSLVELLRSLLRLNTTPDKQIFYLICVWDERNSQQKNSTIEKIYSSLKDYIQDKNDFSNAISKGYAITEQISIKLAYGTNEISEALFKWIGSGDENILNAIQTIIKLVEKWDDLWLSYAIANAELELNDLKNVSNIELLNQKLLQIEGAFDFTSYEKLVLSINELTSQILPLWKEDTLPLDSPSGQTHYIRDLLFLKAYYQKILLK